MSRKTRNMDEISQEFNSAGPSCQRDVECLKRCYENRKKLLRKSVAAQRRETYKTGGGLPDVKDKKEPFDDLLLSIVCNKTVEGLENPFGGAAIETPKCNSHPSPQKIASEENAIEFIFDSDNEDIILDDAQKEMEEEPLQRKQEGKKRKEQTSLKGQSEESVELQPQKWKHYKVQDLKSATNSALNPESSITTPNNATSRRRPRTIVKALAGSDLAEKYNKLVDERLDIARYQKLQLQNQVKAELKEHDLRVELLTLQVQREKQLK